MSKKMDQEFLALPLQKLADICLQKAEQLGASHTDFRLEKVTTQRIRLRDLNLESLHNYSDTGLCVRVIHKGAWGFASTTDLSEASVKSTAEAAVRVAKATASLNQEPVVIADEPVHNDTYVSDYEVNPLEVSDAEKIERFMQLNNKLLKHKNVNFVNSWLDQVQENKFYVNLGGSQVTQQRVRIQGNLEITSLDTAHGGFETMRTNAAPTGRGWEYLKYGGIYALDEEAEELPELLAGKVKSPSVKAGAYDLVIDPTNLFLTIHESVGHATEFDRALGYEANFAGTSFATPDKLNELQYGSELMHITGDRRIEHGLSTVGFDDEGVAAQEFDIVRDGRLVGYQLNRQMAHKFGFGRSNGCAFADSFSHLPIQRMPNISLRPSPKDVSLQDLISHVNNGIYIVGDKSWSIDMQRYNFQFTGQRFYAIKNGKLAGQLKDVIYQSNTLDFWKNLAGLGGSSTYVLGGAFNCGKGQPEQVAPVSHGAPAALFSRINVLNAKQEAGK